MKPIGQTFFINEPPSPTGVAGVYITQIDVYFKSISSVNGVQLQIRTTENGVPTSTVVPFGDKILNLNDLNPNDLLPAVRASSDASKATSFIFDTPAFVESGKSYAFVVAPLGGDPNYQIWTAVVGDKDVTTNTPIYTNNDSGDLFLSSNDRDWIPVITEDIKYTVYIANFTSSSGSAYFTTPNEEWLIYNNPVGTFLMREPLVFSNGYYNISTITVTGSTGTINVGDCIVQGSSNGIVYNIAGSVLKLKNVNGTFGTGLAQDITSVVNTTITATSQNTVTVSGSNTISVPDSGQYSANQVIHVSPADGSITQVVQITTVPNSNTINVNNNIGFSSSSARVGRVYGDGGLTAKFSGSKTYPGTDNNYYAVLDSSTANSFINFSEISNTLMIGLTSQASANFVRVMDPVYNSITPQILSLAPANTDLAFSFQGFANTTDRTIDSSYIPLINETILELYDKERVAMSRSNELGNLPGGRSGTHSVTIKVDMDTANTKISPIVDTIRTNVVYTYNLIPQDYELNGFYLNINNNSSTVSKGDIITQVAYGNTASGTVAYANSTYIRVTNINGAFTSNAAFTDATNSNTGFVNIAQEYNESYNNGYYKASRYISKNIILATGQDSEDIKTYIGAYRPANTNVHMYAKIQHNADNEPFANKAWTKLAETSDNTLLSSSINRNDLVEMVHGFNQSQLLYLANTTTSTSSSNVVCTSTIGLQNNSFVYLLSDSASKTFNVRKVLYVTNSTSFTVDRPPSFSSTNASIGIIPGIESTTSAFLYDQNNNIVRYCTANDAVYDSYIQYAIKFVLVADSSALVPRVSDLRVLNLQV